MAKDLSKARLGQRLNRRQVLHGGLAAAALVSSSPLKVWASTPTESDTADKDILVVVELSGGNDGLNTVVPFREDAYYRARPTIAIGSDKLLTLDDNYGFNPGALGLKRLWDDGELAVVHGCGYDQPSYSHFTSMGYWHTAAPHSGATYGWMGRLADALEPQPQAQLLVNVAANSSLAVASQHHTPVVFNDPARFRRAAFSHQKRALHDQSNRAITGTNQNRNFLNRIAKSAVLTSTQIRTAWADYRSPVDYGIVNLGLPKVAACIAHGLPARLYYVSFQNNAFDTHVQQGPLHQRLLSYASDALYGFLQDMKRLGQAKRVSLLAFSEFGRRLGENANAGTDHGSANLMFLAGHKVAGGHYGSPPDLSNLNAKDNLFHTTDFRRVYASAIAGGLGSDSVVQVLGKGFEPLQIFNNQQST